MAPNRRTYNALEGVGLVPRMSELKEIHVSDLRIGMYVAKLDREWLDTPFLMQGFLIEERDDIDIVAEYCEHVWVDMEASKKGSQYSTAVGTASFAHHSPVEYKSTVQEEHRRVYQSFRKTRQLTKSILDDIRLGGAINHEAAKATVNDCVQSVLRHPDAMLWMAKIRDENEYTAEHSLNVCILAVTFGMHLGFDEAELQKLGLCGLLHDIGKMRVPEEVLNKPEKLTEKEWKMMMAHTIHGRNILLSNPSGFNGVVDVAYSHHERIDGQGYPRKLKGASISQYAKMISIVDAFDAMTADRCYSKAIPTTKALKIIYEDRGTHFDEQLAIQFIKAIGLFPAGSIVELCNGEVGIVIEANRKRRHLPKVILVLDAHKKPLQKERLIDLTLIEKGDIGKEFLIRHVWVDGTFGIKLKEYQEKGLVLKC